MTFDREPDLDNANVGIPEQKGKTESYQIGGFLFYVIGNSYGIPYYIKNIIALGAVVDGCQGNRASARKCAKAHSF